MTEVSLSRGAHFKSAGLATPEILAVSASANRGEYRPFFVLNPATGTLEVPADLRLKAHEAILAEAGRIQLRLNRSLPGLYLRKFGLQLRSAAMNAYCEACRHLLDFANDRHGAGLS